MVKMRSGNVYQRDDQDDSMIKGPQPQEETSVNQEANFRLSIMADIQQMLNQNREQIQNIIEENTRMILNAVTKPRSYKTFLSCQPPEFSGTTGPTGILTWIREMESTFCLCECEEAQKVIFSVSMLKDGALSWWNMTKMLLGKETVSQLTWCQFVEKIKKWYCSDRDFFEMEREFATLEKGDMTVDEYASLFVEKLQFVGHLAPSDKHCVERFVFGLPLEYKMARWAETLDLAIQVAKGIEHAEFEERGDCGEKRKWEGTLGSSKKSKGEVKSCYQCGKVGHLARECRHKGATCFGCGERGHIITICPNREGD